MQLYTQHNFSVVRQIADHTDATVYYVRAVIRNAYTDEIIATLDLDSKGNQRYKKDWRIPADPSGEGFYVSIVTSVYTDSGHTTKSPNYGDEENTFLVIDRPRVVGGSAGNGGGLSRRDVRDIIVEELQNILPKITPKEINIPKQKEYEMRWEEILSSIKTLGDKIKPLDIPKVDLKPILQGLNDIKEIVKKEIEFPEVDLKPIITKIDDLNDNVEKNHKETKDSTETFRENLPKLIAQNTTKALELAKFNISIPFNRLEKDESVTKKKVDLSKLAK